MHNGLACRNKKKKLRCEENATCCQPLDTNGSRTMTATWVGVIERCCFQKPCPKQESLRFIPARYQGETETSSCGPVSLETPERQG